MPVGAHRWFGVIVLRVGMAAGLVSVAPEDVLVILSRAVTLTGRLWMATGGLEMAAAGLGSVGVKRLIDMRNHCDVPARTQIASASG